MRVEQLLNVPAAFLYHQIIDVELFEIYAHTGQQLTVAQLEGFTYQKQLADDTQAQVTITKNIRNRSYHYQTVTDTNRYEVKYDMLPLEKHKSKIVYEEKIFARAWGQRLLDFISDTFLGGLKRHNFKKMFLQIEKSY
ncbi:DUF3284 domain-containing protein [Loigolactobacillus rennini]|uniref:DUF3284 domain-containing protein n=1 Tax=Loigolactobacillus rennini DSM 20253 TaxID=1423796 RepID=A0A0R2D5W2_9LACO|nr:DUF3284 domain-containing protein [Loigolactobacillus rennini]KRM99297.1 hypothetical protein FC24_GL000494 [Loigolactobacillus rennini DSM 20253]